MGNYCNHCRPSWFLIVYLVLLTVIFGSSTGWGQEATVALTDTEVVWDVGTQVTNTGLGAYTGNTLTLLSNDPLSITANQATSNNPITITNTRGNDAILNIGTTAKPFGGIEYIVTRNDSGGGTLRETMAAVDATTLNAPLDITYRGGNITVDVTSFQVSNYLEDTVKNVIGFAGELSAPPDGTRTFDIGDMELTVTANIQRTTQDMDASGVTAGVFDTSTDGSINSSAKVVIQDTRVHDLSNSDGTADVSGEVAGLYSSREVISNGTIEISHVSRSAIASSDGATAMAEVNVRGIVSTDGAATANAAVTIGGPDPDQGISLNAKAEGDNGYANATGFIYGVDAETTATANTVTIQNITYTAGSDADNATVQNYITGVYSNGGTATANGAVTIGGAGELGISSSAIADGTANSDGVIAGVAGLLNATAQSVTIQNINSYAEAARHEAIAGTSIYGVYTIEGNATANGAVTISMLDYTATTAGTGQSARLRDENEDLEIAALFSVEGDAIAHADININNADLNAEALGDNSSAVAKVNFYGVMAPGDDAAATANGAVTIGGAGELGISSSANADYRALSVVSIMGVAGGTTATAQSVTIQNITNTADSITDSAGAGNLIYGVVANSATATVNGAVTIGGAGDLGINSSANSIDGDAESDGMINGVYGTTAAIAQSVTIQNITSVTNSIAGDATGGYIILGVGASEGNATANGTVTISELKFTASTQGDDRTAQLNELSIIAVMSAEGDATANADININSAILKAEGGDDSSAFANAYFAGVVSSEGAATANGSVTIQNISIETEAPYRDSNADLRLFGVYAYGGDAKAGPVSLTDINVASTGGTKANARLDAVGIYGINGDATANGAITIVTSAMATLKDTDDLNPVAAINASYGLRAQRGSMYEYEDNPLTPSSDPVWARAYGDGAINITAHSLVSRTGETTNETVQFAQAVGIQAENILVDTLGSTTRKNITAAGDDYAFAIRAENMLEEKDSRSVKFSPTITNLNGDIRLSANTSRPGNDFDRDDIAFILGPDVIKLLSPIAEAEYLAIGADDFLNIALGAGVTSINGGHPYRLFGGEKINLNSGTLRLTYGAGASWVANQKEFNTILNEPTDPGYGDVSGPARQTVFNLNSGATLAASGDMTPLLGYDQGVHTTLFTTDGQFIAGRDYDLILNANDRSGLQLDYDPTLPLLQPDTALNDASPLPQVNGLRLTGTSNFAAGSLFHTTLVGGATQDPLADPNAAMLHVMGATNSKGESAYGVNIAKGAKLSLGFTAAAAQTILDFRGESLRYYIISSEAGRMLGTAGSWAPDANIQFDDDILGLNRLFDLKSQGIDNTSFDRDAYFLELGYDPEYERDDPRANTMAMMFWQPWRQPFQRLDENSRLARQRRAFSDPCLNPCADPCAAGFTRGWNVWAEGYRQTGSVDADAYSHGYGFDRNAVFLGIDKTFADRFTLGLLGVYSNPGLKQSGRFVQSEITSDDYEVALYGQYRFNWDLYLKAYAGYGRTHYDSRRELFDTGIHDLYQGSFSGDAFYASLELNRPFQVLPCFELTPVLALDYAKIWQDGFVESRSGFGARNGLDLRGYGAADDHRLHLRVGLDASFSPTERITLTGRAQYYRLLSGSAAPDSVIYPDFVPITVNARGADAGRDYVRLGLAGRVDLNTEKTVYLFGGYDYDRSSGSHTHSGQVGVGFMW